MDKNTITDLLLDKKIKKGNPIENARVQREYTKNNCNMVDHKLNKYFETKSILGNSAIITIVSPEYLADALLCLQSYLRNTRNKSTPYIFIATNDPGQKEVCESILSKSNVLTIFPDTLVYTGRFSKALAKEYGNKNIYCNVIVPGYFKTELTDANASDMIVEQFIRLSMLQREGAPDEFGKAIVFLASDLSSFVNGDVLYVTGGLDTIPPYNAKRKKKQ